MPISHILFYLKKIQKKKQKTKKRKEKKYAGVVQPPQHISFLKNK
jgi:hypothetical protein